jgi:hypothetical protein
MTSVSNLRATPSSAQFTDLYVPALTPDFTTSTTMVLSQRHEHRPDLLAHELYRDARLWWVFTLYNMNSIQDPINDFIAGMTITVPNKDAIG